MCNSSCTFKKLYERQVQNKLAQAKRDASQQTKDSAPNAQSNVMTPPLPPAREGHNFPGIRSVGVDETPRTGKKVQGGSWSGHHRFRGLKWGQDNFELPLKMNLVDIESGVGGRRPDPPQQAEPVTMGMIECLEIFIADPTTSMVAKHLAAAYLFCKGSNKHKSAGLTRYAMTSSLKVTFVWTRIQYDPRCNPDLSGHHHMESQTQNCTLPSS